MFFATLSYSNPEHITTKEKRTITFQDKVLLVCGIADPESLASFLNKQTTNFSQLIFPDHHNFCSNDIEELKAKGQDKTMIITTEKDAVRLLQYEDEIWHLPLFVLPVCHRFLFNESNNFENTLQNFLAGFKIKNKKDE